MAGLEPTISESKSGVLPLHYIPPSTCAKRPALPASRFSGVGDGARTHDTRNHNPVLIPTELHPPLMEPCPGTPGGTRTPGLLLRRQLLYPAELLAHICTRRVLAHSNRGGAPPRKAYLVYHHSAALSRAMLRPRREFFEFFRAGANPQRRRSGSPRSRRRNIQTSTPAAAQASTTSAVSWE